MDYLDNLSIPRCIKPGDRNRYRFFRRWCHKPNLTLKELGTYYGIGESRASDWMTYGIRKKWFKVVKEHHPHL